MQRCTRASRHPFLAALRVPLSRNVHGPRARRRCLQLGGCIIPGNVLFLIPFSPPPLIRAFLTSNPRQPLAFALGVVAGLGRAGDGTALSVQQGRSAGGVWGEPAAISNWMQGPGEHRQGAKSVRFRVRDVSACSSCQERCVRKSLPFANAWRIRAYTHTCTRARAHTRTRQHRISAVLQCTAPKRTHAHSPPHRWVRSKGRGRT